MSAVFINLSNHPLTDWRKEQLNEARNLGEELIDLPFPNVSPSIGAEEIRKLAEVQIERIIDISKNYDSAVVHIVGEPNLVFEVVTMLKMQGITCVASTTERISTNLPGGQKISEFKFIRFREY